MTDEGGLDDLLRELAPQVLGPLVRRFGGFDACEDAVQEALLAAATQWPAEGVPASPKGCTPEIARAFLVPETTIGQRISRAEQQIKATGAEFRMPPPGELPDRITAVLKVLY